MALVAGMLAIVATTCAARTDALLVAGTLTTAFLLAAKPGSASWGLLPHDPIGHPDALYVLYPLGTLATLSLSLVLLSRQRYRRLLLTRRLARSRRKERTQTAEAAQLLEQNQKLLCRFVEVQRFEGLSQLSASAAHDLNNSVQVIHGCCSHLQQLDGLDDEARDACNEILQVCKDTERLAAQLLTLGQNKCVHRQVVDVYHELVTLQKNVSFLLPSNVDVRVEAKAGAWMLWADPSQLRQALLNLCINAGHAMPNGGTLALALRQRGRRELEVVVSDTGVGMPESVQSKIFNPFFTTKGSRGSGLGLTAVQAIVENHGGTIGVRSRLGGGSAFSLIFPLLSDMRAPSASGTFLRPAEATLLARTLTHSELSPAPEKVACSPDGADGDGPPLPSTTVS